MLGWRVGWVGGWPVLRTFTDPKCSFFFAGMSSLTMFSLMSVAMLGWQILDLAQNLARKEL